MLFSSYSFLFFFPLVLILVGVLPVKWRNPLLLLASYFFYSCWSRRYCLLLLGCTAVAYFAGRLLEKRKWTFWAGLVTVLGILAVFKYTDFLLYTLEKLVSRPLPRLSWVLPVGISFFTFQAAGYLIDVYQGKYKAETNFVNFALFVSFFPQLLSGPIGRGGELLPQYRQPKKPGFQDLRNGLCTMTWGYFLKLVIADRAAMLVDSVYGAYASLPGICLVFATVVYALQIYCDFAGYSAMAIGAGQMLGIRLPVNFRTPYFAQSVQEFWRRWHISLSTWFRDYVYFTLGGSRCAPWRHYLNIVIVFVCSGLWHGADWRYLAWGLATGLCAAFGVMTAKARKRLNRFNPLYRMGWFKALWQCLVTNALFCLTLVFFASAIYNTDPFAVYGSLLQGWDGLAGSWAQVSGLIYSSGIDGRLPVVLLFGCFVVFAAEHGGRSVARWIRQQVWPLRWTLYYAAAAAILFFAAFGQSAFIYQQY